MMTTISTTISTTSVFSKTKMNRRIVTSHRNSDRTMTMRVRSMMKESDEDDGTTKGRRDDVDVVADRGTSRRMALTALTLAPMLRVSGIVENPPAQAKFVPKNKAGAAPPTPESQFEALRTDIVKLMARDKDFGPTMVRLAWHSSGTYDRMTKTGGSGGGTIRFKEELAHGGNAGLDKAVKKLEPIKKRHPDVSWADLIAYVGVVAIEEMGGPKLKFSYGRVDEMDPSKVTPDGRLPDADKGDGPGAKTQAGLRDVFYRMGFNDKEIVALSGAHALGRCHADASGYVGPWTGTPLLFNNSYFVLLKGLKWEPNLDTGKFQYKDPSGQLMMLPSDIALIKDPKFKRYVDVYAKSQDKFFEDFAAAFEKLELLGTSNLTELK
jgi:cytochrome c peroxidase